MNPLTRLYRRSLVFRVVCYVSLVPLLFVLWFVADDGFETYSQVGDVAVLVLFICFGLWAWWYSEHRDHQQVARAAGEGGAPSPGGDGG